MFFIKKWLRGVMGFSRAESNGFLILLPVVIIIVFSEPITEWIVSKRTDDFSKENHILDSLVQLSFKKINVSTPQPKEFEKSKAFSAFDPNNASLPILSELGFSRKMADRLIKYRSKGGIFRIKSDLMKIYGMDSSFYQHLYAFILLPEKIDRVEHDKKDSRENVVVGKKIIERFDLNKADTTQLKTIFGIGPTLANRIVKYRLRLGGFIRPDQLKEVYGLDSTVIKRVYEVSFLEPDFQVSKIDINTSSEKDLQTHPYVTRAMAKSIVAYRFQHGDFKNVEEIRNLVSVKSEVADKLIPYLKVK